MTQPHIHGADNPDTRLAEFGLSIGTLTNVFRRAEGDVRMCTKHDPPTMRGMTRWARVVRYLREELAEDGWDYDNPGNLPRVIHPTKPLAIYVKSGDDATGTDLPQLIPSSKRPMGSASQKVVNDNEQLALYSLEDLRSLRMPQNWVLLYHIDDVVQAELSLPDKISDSRIMHWLERIILPAIDIGPDHVGSVYGPDDEDDGGSAYSVQVERRKQP